MRMIRTVVFHKQCGTSTNVVARASSGSESRTMRPVAIRGTRCLFDVATVSVALAVLSAARQARAGDAADLNSQLRLAYQAPQTCETAAGFRERVVSLTRSPPRTWKSVVEVRVTIERTERGYVGRLGVVHGDMPDRVPSERTLGAATCSSVVEAIAISTALAIDEVLEEDETPRAPPPVEPGREESPLPVAPIVPHRKPATPKPRAPQRPLDVRMGDAVALRGGLAPDPLILNTAWLSVARPGTISPLPVRGELTFGASPVARTAEGAYRTRLLEVAVATCTPAGGGLLAVFALCAGVGAGVLATSSFEVVRPAERERLWIAAFTGPRLSIPLMAGLHLALEGRLVVPFFRENQTFFPGITAYEAPAAAWQSSFGLEVRLPARGP
ncbi:MAG: hypothetical protein K0S65_5869 [Labilithrix sp.]|nr:hypothetical protein [Labilithrix sp.]